MIKTNRNPMLCIHCFDKKSSSEKTHLKMVVKRNSSISSCLTKLSVFNLSSTFIWCVLLFSLSASGVIGRPEAIGQQAEKDETAFVDNYLSSFGYYHHKDQNTNTHSVSDKGSKLDEPRADNPPKVIHTDEERRHALRRLQAFYNLPLTGVYDAATQNLMKGARCGREDVKDDEDVEQLKQDGKTRRKRYAVARYADDTIAKWKADKLTWRITAPSKQISTSQQRDIFRRAIAVWGNVVPVRFEEDRGTGEPDIDVRFVRRQHGPSDDPVFDGSNTDRANVLAHAWGPHVQPKGLNGDVHFDEDDTWSNTDTLLGVAVHELGHTMGLLHSSDSSSIMYPVYRDSTVLTRDDLDGINAIYKSWPESNRPTTRYPISHRGQWTPDSRYRTDRPETRYRTDRPDPRYRPERPDIGHRTDRPDPRYRPERPDLGHRTERPDARYRPQRPDPPHRTDLPGRPFFTVKPEWAVTPATTTPQAFCQELDVSAVFEDPTSNSRGNYMAITGENVHHLAPTGALLRTTKLTSVYPELPDNIDIAFSVRETAQLFIIKGKQIWAYRNNQLKSGYPRSLDGYRFPETPRFALSYTESNGRLRTLLFGQTYFWDFRTDREEAYPVSPQPIANNVYRTLPRDVMFTTKWTDDNVYVVTSNSYFIFDPRQGKITHEKPFAGKPAWLQSLCNSGHGLSTTGVLVLLISLLAFFTSSQVNG
ncbi:stromelysin-1-like isoform X1 [Physella acuta]|uniref:stromelysin-1-like isoform X1 n=1 Tax=Physella acuta TaxID=109671 RepID=UPI0027DE536A|nr:stromelysin-1-like isoform X1 [Physella acuta]